MQDPHIGRSLLRREGRAKVTGQARYVDDLALPGMLHGITVRSPVPRGYIKSIDYGPADPAAGFTIVTAADIPGANRVTLILDDQPYLAHERVNHPEEPILLLAHHDRQALEEARRHIVIDIEPEPAVFSMDDALEARTVIWGKDNVFKQYEVVRGDVDAAFGSAPIVVEGVYET